MDLVHVFNDELHSLLASKPPVSKAKMGLITKAAMKGVKFYKHIVQCVEKFIARCRPEYKVPGLYVIDSIVRQSRHQFGPERDVYAARFARNLGITFENLFGDCSPDDKSRMVRVLNLWLKNQVFDMRTIRPLLDMATPNAMATSIRDPKSPSSGDTNSGSGVSSHPRYNTMAGGAALDEKQQRLNFSKNMLDFDYGEDDEGDDADETPTEAEPPLRSTLSKIEMEQQQQRSSKKSSSMMMNHNESLQDFKRVAVPNQSSHHIHKSSQQPSKQPNQDPVLERWNRILKGDLSSDQPFLCTTTTNNNYQIQHRSRSRSPTVAHSSGSSQPKDYPAEPHRVHKEAIDGLKSSASKQDSERERKCLPKIRDRHLTVCSSTLWLGHVPKSVTEADISNALGEFGTINSIDLIPPRGCAYVCMDRRQDAKRALSRSKHLKLNGSHIKMAWAPGKGLKEQKKLKDFWESDIGASFIPYSKVEDSMDFDTLEEGGVIDEDSMSLDMREKRDNKAKEKDREASHSTDSAQVQSTSSNNDFSATGSGPALFNQPPPSSNAGVLPFVIPPPPMHLGIPPPMLLGQQGLIPFPPPSGISLASSGQMLPTSSSHDSSEPRDLEQPPTSMAAERKLSIVDQQLSMLTQQAQGMIQGQPPIFFNPNHQPDPSVFDFRGQPHPQMMMIHSGIMELPHHQQMAMFDGHMHPMLIGHRPQMLTFDQHAGMVDLSDVGDESYIAHQHDEY